MMKRILLLSLFIPAFMGASAQIPTQPGHPNQLVNEPLDISGDFRDFTNSYYVADSLAQFDPQTGVGVLSYKRYQYTCRTAFNNMLGVLKPVPAVLFPENEYQASPKLPFRIEFVSDRCIRIKALSGSASTNEESLMLVGGKAPIDKDSWKVSNIKGGFKYSSRHGSVEVMTYPWSIKVYNAKGELLTSTVSHSDYVESSYTPVLPFSFVRRSSDYSRSYNAAFNLSPNEKIFGCGESFTQLNKRGQKVVLFADDANGVQNETMYKPIPFYLSSKGYGVFMHTSSPITCDFGKYFNSVSSLMIGDDQLDLFLFIGEPKDILNSYTELTGKSPMPPLWSFGLWMSRITYFSESDGRNVAQKLRENQIPCDVIHFDTGWFEHDWRCDYQFSASRFNDAGKMISDLKSQGFHISLWQLPYFVPNNSLYQEIVAKGLFVKDGRGNSPYEDVVLDFSNPQTVEWYQQKIAGLLRLGVGAIKVDFGEAAPMNGIYSSGKSGFYEHNLYPLRYNKAVAEITKQVNNENIIWARSAWAGSQRYPLHWGGDSENSYNGMAAELRGGLSFGLSGFTFWSHDIGGFVLKTPENIYRKWLPFGILTSHSRAHGAPPKEPWEYNANFNSYYRKVVEMKYELMPYIYAQAKASSEKGLPMVRALFVEFPNDPGAWNVDDEYTFGSDILVAPIFNDSNERDVYLPGGSWIDYQTGKVYKQGWNRIAQGDIEAIILVRDGAAIPHIKLAQSTKDMDWSKINVKIYAVDNQKAEGYICLPSNNMLQKISLTKSGGSFKQNRNDEIKGTQITIETIKRIK